jgi:hypothetical protein
MCLDLIPRAGRQRLGSNRVAQVNTRKLGARIVHARQAQHGVGEADRGGRTAPGR